jgi:hypothetical protein
MQRVAGRADFAVDLETATEAIVMKQLDLVLCS